jgi:hypothetical protein
MDRKRSLKYYDPLALGSGGYKAIKENLVAAFKKLE